jgi:hypothetical protein
MLDTLTKAIGSENTFGALILPASLQIRKLASQLYGRAIGLKLTSQKTQ